MEPAIYICKGNMGALTYKTIMDINHDDWTTQKIAFAMGANRLLYNGAYLYDANKRYRHYV